MKEDKSIITDELIQLIQRGNAHASLEEAVADLPAQLRTRIPDSLPYSIWQLTEHIRITQWDIVEFCISANHKSPKWPDEYWPEPTDKADDKQWNASLLQIRDDRQRFIELLNKPESNLTTPLPHGDGQSLLREAMLIADHTSYHIGQIIVIRRLLNAWKS